MDHLTNMTEELLPSDTKRAHAVKIATNQLVKLSEENNIPIFIAYYDPIKGYQYNGVLPEDCEKSEDLYSQYERFYKFLEICILFNKEDCRPHISKKNVD